MIIHSVKCEMCDTKHDFSYTTATWRELPSGWLTLFSGDGNLDGWHFCSDKCLVQWTTGNIEQEQSNKPSCKMRRFVLIKDETGTEYEGVLLGSGYVIVDFGHGTMPSRYSSWSGLIQYMADGDRIRWIDAVPGS